MKKIILAMSFLFVVFILGCTKVQTDTQANTQTDAQKNTDTNQNTNQQTQVQTQGRVVFGISDAAANMNSVTRVMVTIDKVEVHSDAKGWFEVSSEPMTYNLLELKASGKLGLLANAQLDEGNYNQIRLDISKVMITDVQGEHDAKLPSNELKINSDFEVKENSTSTAAFDFAADESLHVTGNGKYIMTPVVQVDIKEDADVNVKPDNSIEIKGGKTKGSIKVGMDLNGNVGVGIRVPADVNISIETDGLIKAKGSGKGSVGVSTDII